MRLVLIHGRAQQGKNAAELQRLWQEGLDCGLAAASLSGIGDHEIVFPYYGDTLVTMIEEMKASSDAGAVSKGAPLYDASIDRTILELQQEILASDVAATQDVATAKGLQNTALALALARAADKTPFGKDLLSQWTEDVAVYLKHFAVAHRINSMFATAIGTEPCVVVAHSLGSIIAYRVLRDLGKSANVRRLITLGSPLGLETIRRQLAPPARTFPSGVESWFNAFDPKDIVALHPLDTTTWDVRPPIVNHGAIRNHMDNHHGISGYLDDAHVAAAIHEALNGHE